MFNPAIVFIGLGCCLLVAIYLGLAAGAEFYTFYEVWAALINGEETYRAAVIREVRILRTAAAILVGVALAIGGCLLQGISRNPLASPSLLAVNQGASFAVVFTTSVVGYATWYLSPIFATLGAAVAVAGVYFLSSAGNSQISILKLILAGAVIGAFLTALTTAILIFDQATLDKVRMWTVGSLSFINRQSVILSAVPIVIAAMMSLTLGAKINLLQLGDDRAQSLGINVSRLKTTAVFTAVLLAAAAVTVVGPLLFVGLIAPHLVRLLTNTEDYKWLLPCSALSGALILLLADVLMQELAKPQQIPVGIGTALIGAPLFIYLARQR